MDFTRGSPRAGSFFELVSPSGATSRPSSYAEFLVCARAEAVMDLPEVSARGRVRARATSRRTAHASSHHCRSKRRGRGSPRCAREGQAIAREVHLRHDSTLEFASPMYATRPMYNHSHRIRCHHTITHKQTCWSHPSGAAISGRCRPPPVQYRDAEAV